MHWSEKDIRVEELSTFEPSWNDLESANDENPFMHAAVELLKSAVTLVSALAGTGPAEPLQLHAAIRCGLLVRSCKLGMDLLADACIGKGRIQLGLSRQLVETLANIVYLCRDDMQGSRHVSFLQDSLIAERELLRTIEKRRTAGGGKEWEIEKRMRRSISRTAQAAGIDPDQLPPRSQNGWPSALRRIELAFGATAYPSFRTGSDSLHGGWRDIYRNHLREVDGGFEPEFEPRRTRPQPLLSAAILLAEVGLTYLSSQPAQERKLFMPVLAAAVGYARRADDIHEAWLAQDT